MSKISFISFYEEHYAKHTSKPRERVVHVTNLTTGTRYMNTQGMLPFENMTADNIKST